MENGVEPADFNSYGARRGNHEVMMRGTFANIRIRNEMLGGKEGGNTICFAGDSQGEEMSIYDAAMKYEAAGTSTVNRCGQGYARPRAFNVLGIRAVIGGKLRGALSPATITVDVPAASYFIARIVDRHFLALRIAGEADGVAALLASQHLVPDADIWRTCRASSPRDCRAWRHRNEIRRLDAFSIRYRPAGESFLIEPAGLM